MGLSESGASRFDRTNVELVAGNIRVVSKIFEGGLSHRFDQINGGIVVKELPGDGHPSHPRCFLGLEGFESATIVLPDFAPETDDSGFGQSPIVDIIVLPDYAIVQCIRQLKFR